MAFGQQSGPPASSKQVEELLALFEGAGYSSFREARQLLVSLPAKANSMLNRPSAQLPHHPMPTNARQSVPPIVRPKPLLRCPTRFWPTNSCVADGCASPASSSGLPGVGHYYLHNFNRSVGFERRVS